MFVMVKKLAFIVFLFCYPFKAVLFYYLYGNWCDLAILFKRIILNKQKQQQQTSMLLKMISEKTHIENTFTVIAMKKKVFIFVCCYEYIRQFQEILVLEELFQICFVGDKNKHRKKKKKIKLSWQKDNPSSGDRDLFHFLNI